jgi:hypothetical protein
MRTEFTVIVFGGLATVIVDYGAAPRVIFSDPQAAPVGPADGLDRRLAATIPAVTEARS